MRDEFYADRRDLCKWNIALRLAGLDGTILYVAMLRPRASRSAPRGVDGSILGFFRREWVELDREPLCSRIRNLSPKIKPVLDYYQQSDKSAYFQKVVTLIKQPRESGHYVVLLDPDTGLAGAKPTREHLCWDDVTSVWDAMKVEDILLIYQHNQRRKKQPWLAGLQHRIAELAGKLPEQISCYSCADVSFLSATK